MFDCDNVEMRELLPELAAGPVDAETRARVEQHVTTCAECASELETLKLVRSAYGAAPAVDVSRIVAALPKPAAAPIAVQRKPVKRWVDWRIAAALTTITVGGLSLAVAQRYRGRTDLGPDTSVAIVQPAVSQPTRDVTTAAPNVSKNDSGRSTMPSTRSAVAAKPTSAKAELSFGGGMSDLDDATLKSLLGALDEIDRAPVAPSAEPDPTPVLPVIKGTDQ
jgi:anti-sigma factor RsiW